MDLAPIDPRVEPDAIRSWCDLVFGYLDGLVPVRLIAEKGTKRQDPVIRFVAADALAEHIIALAPVAADEHRAVFVVPGVVATAGKAGARDIRQTGVILADLDDDDVDAKRDHLVQYLGQPSLEVASGGKTEAGQIKRHLFWRLTEAASGADLDLVSELRDKVARKTGGDTSFGSLHQPIRVAGTIHGKHGLRSSVRIIAQNTTEYDLAEIAEAIRSMPARATVGPDISIDTGTKLGRLSHDLMTAVIREGGMDGTTRFAALSTMIGHWVRAVRLGRCSLAEAWLAIQEYNTAMIRPPWEEEKLRGSFEGILRKDIENMGQMPNVRLVGQPAMDVQAPVASDDYLAARFTEMGGADWKHVQAWGAWFTWAGSHWTKDDVGAVSHAVRLICRSEAGAVNSPAEARRLASNKTIQAVQRIVSSDPEIARGANAFDQHRMLLNTPAGVLDLETGDLRPHERALLLTQITCAALGKGCPRWLAFLAQVTDGDADLQAYLARVAGYCLTGSTKEQVFFFLHGFGANGKSVFLQTLAFVMGDYAATATADAFTNRGPARHLTEIAGLRAARLVLVSETEAGEGWAEARIKMVTGGEKLRANFMYHDHFEFTPLFKLMVAGNHRPSIGGVSEAMRRRLHLIPFSVTIPLAERDADLAARLRDEASGILGWMVDGCAEWQHLGLKPPPSVVDAGENYFAAEDLVGQWIAECCQTGPGLGATARALFVSWSEWAKTNGFDPRSARILGEQFRIRGFRDAKIDRQRGWLGIAPSPPRPGSLE